VSSDALPLLLQGSPCGLSCFFIYGQFCIKISRFQVYLRDKTYLHPKATQMIEAFDPANQLVKDEVLALPEE